MVDISKHPLLKQCCDLCQAIEECGASEKLTKAVIMCSELMENLDKELVLDKPKLKEGQILELVDGQTIRYDIDDERKEMLLRLKIEDEDEEKIVKLFLEAFSLRKRKGQDYGDSWKSLGSKGEFPFLVAKVDRLKNTFWKNKEPVNEKVWDSFLDILNHTFHCAILYTEEKGKKNVDIP